MSRIVFFSINASGHTNPTLPVVSECIARGHEVWYYHFKEFETRIKETGAKFKACDKYLPEPPKNIDKKAGKDFSALIGMIADTTINLQDKAIAELKIIKPDCIVSDSMCLWGRLYAEKLGIPYICSTTTFAFNKFSSRIMKRSISDIFHMFYGMPKIKKHIKALQDNGYKVNSIFDIIENKEYTETIVYTSREFQPFSETFSKHYSFVGPSINYKKEAYIKSDKPLIYISLGTVLNGQQKFYKACFKALSGINADVLASVGKETDIKSLGDIPDNFKVVNFADQISVLKSADVFITHCGMNSANEAIFFGVPTVMYPLQSEEAGVASRMEQLKLGVLLKKSAPKQIRAAVEIVLNDKSFRENNLKMSKSFIEGGGCKKAADKIESIISDNSKKS